MRAINNCYLIPTFILVLLSNSLLCQEEIGKDKWKFGIHLSPEIAYRTLKGDKNNETIQHIIEFRNDMERPAFLFSGGLSAEYKISKIFSLKSGIHHTMRGEASRDVGVGSDFGSSGIYLEKFIYRNQYHYVGIPIAVSAYFPQMEKAQLFGSVGVELNFLYLLSSYSTFKFSGEEEKTEFKKFKTSEMDFYDYAIFNPSLMLSIGCDLKIGNKSTLRIEPIYRKSLLPLEDTPIKGYYYNCGINLGYLYSL